MHNPDEPLRYLELGSGQQDRINLHAAAMPDWQFYGLCDHPAAAQQAKKTAVAAGLEATIMDISIESFAEQGIQNNLPLFDVIAIDRAWSTVSEEERQHLLAITGRHIKPGGIICLGYHAMPGCVPLVPLRDLMLQQTAASASDGKADPFVTLQALYFTDTYAEEADSGFFAQVPTSRQYLESIKLTPFEQLQRDWLNPDWKPFYFADISQQMETVRCRFAASLNLSSQLDMCLPEGTVPLLHQEEDPVLRETIRDFGLNQHTRLDLFARGISLVDPASVTERLEAVPFGLTLPLEAIDSVVLPSPLGDLHFDDEIYTLFLKALSEDSYRPKTLTELKAHSHLEMLDGTLFPAVINILVAAGTVFPARATVTLESEKACARLNRILCEYSRDGNIQPALASPVLGTGIGLSRVWQLFLLAHADGAVDPLACAKAVLPILAGTSGTGQPDHAQTGAALEEEARLFFEIGLPYLIAMKVCPARQPSEGILHDN